MKQPTWSGDWPIPRVIRLPGCRVKIRVVDPKDRPVLNECDGIALYSHEKQACSILIDGSLPLAQQRYTLIHEMGHIYNEWRDVMLEHYPLDVQHRRRGEVVDEALVASNGGA